MTATELLERAGMKKASLAPRELERRMTSEGLATVRDGRMIPTARARGLIDALQLERRGDGVRRANRLG